MTGIRRKARDLAISTVFAFQRKLQVWRRGYSDVPDSCQIPDLRAHYRQLGLPENRGVFVEIGGFDGDSWSNTSFLADQGWRGVYVEPVPHYARRIRLRHMLNRVTVEQAAIAAQRGQFEIAVMGPLTTMNPATEEAYNTIEWAKGMADAKEKLIVPTETLPAILAKNDVPPDFELLVIDVEGAEEPIVDALVESRWRPRTIIIELVDRHADFEAHPEVMSSHRATREKIARAGYAEFFSDNINTIFKRA